MALPLTSTARAPIMPIEDVMGNGYKSDGQLGPFLQEGVSEDTSFCMDEAPIQGGSAPNIEATETTKNVDKSVIPDAANTFNSEIIEKMKVVELRKKNWGCMAYQRMGTKGYEKKG